MRRPDRALKPPAPARIRGYIVGGVRTATAIRRRDAIDVLRRVRAFESLTESELAEIAAVATRICIPAGHVVFYEGDYADSCYVICRGRARSLRKRGEGRQVTLAVFEEAEVFGELALFEDPRRGVTLEALDDLEVLRILNGDLQLLMSRRPEITTRMAVALGRRLRAANERITGYSLQTVPGRVANVLLQLVAQARIERASERDVVLVATQAQVAELAGVSRESASRFLGSLERAGVISRGYGRLVVHEPDTLREYVY